MSLIDLWKQDSSQISEKNVQQIISFAGEGKLLDGNGTSIEFRELLSEVPSELLQKFSHQCLEQPNNGFILQDVINEIGVRLGFDVERGRYQGRQGVIGFDGLWKFENERALVIEVKTTDAYRINIDTISEYRNALVQKNAIAENKSSILIIVGRNDTGDLEAQIRGSRHAWDIRLISVDSLISLMLLKQNIEDPQILKKMHDVLVPREYTKLDEIVELIFSTAEDAKSDEIRFPDSELKLKNEPNSENASRPMAYHNECVSKVSAFLKKPFVSKTKVLFSTSTNDTSLVCLVSREYDHGERRGYWFGFHPYQLDFLKSMKQGYLALGCGTEAIVFLIDVATFEKWLIDMNKTVRPNRLYWHVHIDRDDGKYILKLRNQRTVELNQYLI
jgi:hypothetical protein